MTTPDLASRLRFYFVTDDGPAAPPAEAQVRAAIRGGATMVQYRNKRFSEDRFGEVRLLRSLCRANGIPFIVNDHLLLARAVGADGVHLGQDDAPPALARAVLGPEAVIGVSCSTPAEIRATDLSPCDYVGSGPVFATATKADAKPVRGLAGLSETVSASPLPVVAIGGIDAGTAAACLAAGAAGVAVIGAVARAPNPDQAATAVALACGLPAPRETASPWTDEFALIDALLASGGEAARHPALVLPPGDDACRLAPLSAPVVSTDTQREGVHFRRSWHSPEAVGDKAVEVTFSDLAAAYATPVALFVNLGMPEDLPESEAARVYRGIGEALRRHGAGLGGGNVSRAEALTLDLFAVGEGRKEGAPTRAAAVPGDGLYATGPLGLARCGRLCLERGEPDWPRLVERFRHPRARFDAARVLAEAGVRCVMDLSDGLAGDAAHIARAAGVSVELDASAAARDPDFLAFCRAHGLDPERTALEGGEDYELLFAYPEERFEALGPRLPGAVRVGRCRPFSGSPVANLPDGIRSFHHGRR